MENIQSFIIISLLVPVILSFYISWLKKGGFGSVVATNVLLTLNFSIYTFLFYKTFSEALNPFKIFFLVLPIILGFSSELYFLIKSSHQRLHQLNKYMLISSIFYWGILFFDKTQYIAEGNIVKYSDSIGISLFTYFVFSTVILQGLLLYTTFALYRKINPNAKIAFRFNTAKIDKGIFLKFDKLIFGNNDTSFTLEHTLEKKGEIEDISYNTLVKVIVKYLGLILLFYIYGYIIMKSYV